MQIMIWHTHYVDWQALPKNVKPTEADFKALRVKSTGQDSHVMRVVRPAPDGETHTAVQQHEVALAEYLIHVGIFGPDDAFRPVLAMHRGKLTRALVTAYLLSLQMRHHGEVEHFTKLEVHDHGPDEGAFRAAAARYVAEGLLTPETADKALAAYLADKEDVGAFLTKFFALGGE